MAAPEEIKKVLVALKNNKDTECKAALHWAITTFIKPGVDEAVLGHVLKFPDLIPTAMGRVPFAWAEDKFQNAYLKVDTEKAEVFLKDYQEVCKEKSVTASFEVRWCDDRESGILSLVEETEATHLVMGTGSAKSKFTTLLKGKSLTARVAKHARCSVYLVNNRAELVTSHIYDGKRGPAGSGAASSSQSNDSSSSTPSSTASPSSVLPPAVSPHPPSPLPQNQTVTAPHIPPATPALAIPSAPALPPGDYSHPWGSIPSPHSQPSSSPRSLYSEPGPSPRGGHQPPNLYPQSYSGFINTESGNSIPATRTSAGRHNGSQNGNSLERADMLTGPQVWVNSDGQRLSGYEPEFQNYEERQRERGGQRPASNGSAEARFNDGELAEVLRKLKMSEEATARLQAQQADYERQLREAESRALSANSLAEAERARALAAHQERELAKQESALARRAEQDARDKERAAQEAAERERQERVVERQQAAEHYKELLERQKAQRQYRAYSFRELEAATDSFSPAKLLGEGGFGQVYLGRLEHTPAAIKILNPEGLQGPDEFQREVEILSGLRHPHIVMLMGCCPERGCLVYEYCANGSLEDRLARKGDSAALPWFTRIRIAFEVAVALLYMHTSRPSIIHKDLKPSNILLDQNLTSKLGDVGIASVAPELATATFTGMTRRRGGGSRAQTSIFDSSPQGTPMYIDPEYQQKGTFNQKSDVYAFGICLLQLLTNRPPLGIVGAVEDALDEGNVMPVVDQTAGSWPEEVATSIANLGLKCAEIRRRDRPDLEKEVLPVLEAVRTVAMEAAAREASQGLNQGATPEATGEEDVVPSIFLCPISHDIMEDPVVAADGNTYERAEIARWFQRKRTSPLTNVPVTNLLLTPNLIIRSAIKEWQEGNRRSMSRGFTGPGARSRRG